MSVPDGIRQMQEVTDALLDSLEGHAPAMSDLTATMCEAISQINDMEVAMEMSAEHNALFFSLLAASFTARAVGHEVVPMADRYPPLGFTLIRPASHTTGGDE